MRSALASSRNGPAGPASSRVPVTSLQLRRLSARRCRSAAANQRAMRRKRGHQKAHRPGFARTASNTASPVAIKAAAGSSGRRFRVGGQELFERAVNQDTLLGRAGVGVERLQRPQGEDRSGVEAIGIAHPGSRPGSPSGCAAGRPRAAGGWAGPAAPVRAGRSSWPAQASHWVASWRRPSARPRAESRASRRSSQRDGTVGVPSTRVARVR